MLSNKQVIINQQKDVERGIDPFPQRPLGGCSYKAFILLTQEEAQLLADHQVNAYTLYGFETKLKKKVSDQFQRAMKCLLARDES